MSSTEERIRALVDANLDVSDRTAGAPLDLSRSFADAGVASADVVAFWQLVNEEFGVSISAEEFSGLLTPRDLIAHLEANA